MDTAVAVVQAYLRINGYFTVAEYPVVEAARALTDLDILAVRLHREHGTHPGYHQVGLDAALGASLDVTDMIVGEVKEGRPRLNPAMRDPAVLEAAFVRFGCCSADVAAELVDRLLRHGRVVAPAGHAIRLVAFGNPRPGDTSHYWHTVAFEHVISYLQDYLQTNWSVVGPSQIKDDALGLLLLLEKARRSGRRGLSGTLRDGSLPEGG